MKKLLSIVITLVLLFCSTVFVSADDKSLIVSDDVLTLSIDYLQNLFPEAHIDSTSVINLQSMIREGYVPDSVKSSSQPFNHFEKTFSNGVCQLDVYQDGSIISYGTMVITPGSGYSGGSQYTSGGYTYHNNVIIYYNNVGFQTSMQYSINYRVNNSTGNSEILSQSLYQLINVTLFNINYSPTQAYMYGNAFDTEYYIPVAGLRLSNIIGSSGWPVVTTNVSAPYQN